MGRLAVDTETHLIAPGLLIPRLVCTSLAWGEGPSPAWLPRGAIVDAGAALLDAADTASILPTLLAGELVGHNVPFDLAVLARCRPDVLPDVFSAIKEGRVRDTQVRERLVLLARGGLRRARTALADLVYRHLGEARGRALAALKGPDAWRMRYAELEGTPLEEWPDEAVAYALDDARITLEVHDAQARPLEVGGFVVVRPNGSVVSEDRELRAAWGLHLEAAYGLRTDAATVEGVLRHWHEAADAGQVAGEAGGWVRVAGRDKGKAGSTSKKALAAVVSDAFDGAPPMTKPSKTFPAGQVKSDEDTLLAAAERPGAPDELVDFANAARAARYLSRWERHLVHGTTAPSTYRVTHLLETGRVSISDPPWQQPPKDGWLTKAGREEARRTKAPAPWGVRECVVPRPGYVLCTVDYTTAELVALAQVHIWMGLGDTMARVLNAGEDIHLRTAAAIDHVPYAAMGARYAAGDPTAKHLRNLAKVANFGFPGGLGAARFVEYAGTWGVVISIGDAKALRDAWLRAWPEMRGYFDFVARQTRQGTFTYQHPVSMRVRGDVGYTDGCNGAFQGLVADLAKDAVWRLARAAYVTPSSAFYGSRPVVMLHDEVIAEVPEATAHEAAAAMTEIMLDAAHDHIPDVTMRAEPALMTRWLKDAAPVFEGGRLVPWK